MRMLKHKKALFAAFSAAGYVGGQATQAAAVPVCSCFPATSLTKIAASAFQYLGSATAGWIASISTNDSLYTALRTDTGPFGYADFKTGSGTGGAWATVCRRAYLGNAVNCTGSSINNWSGLAGNTNYDEPIDFSGAISSAFSPWDYQDIAIAGSQQGMTVVGAGISRVAACW